MNTHRRAPKWVDQVVVESGVRLTSTTRSSNHGNKGQIDVRMRSSYSPPSASPEANDFRIDCVTQRNTHAAIGALRAVQGFQTASASDRHGGPLSRKAGK